MKKLFLFTYTFFLFSVVFCCHLQAQLGQKPSANYTEEKTIIKTDTSSLSAIKGPQDFDKLSRVYNEGTFNEIPHLLFAIDRKQKNKIYYINTPKYEFHLYFINDLLGKNYIPDDIESNYADSARRFILGTISYQSLIKSYAYEFWDGDKITPELLLCAQQVISGSFTGGIIFKSNSTLQEDAAKTTGIKYVTQDEIVKKYPYIALNPGKAKGRIRIADSIDSIKNISSDDILVLKEVPISIPMVAGIITERASTLLSHVNILARGLKIPNIYLKDASTEMMKYNDKYVELKADENNYKIKIIDDYKNRQTKKIKYSIQSDISKKNLIPLDNMRADDNIYCGAKAANLGEMKAKVKEIIIPDGFSIPFAYYHSFRKQFNLARRIEEMEKLPGFNDQVELRKTKLAELRQAIESANIDSTVVNEWIRQWNEQLYGKGVFVRSSSNAEDLKNFNGAGLFTTVPNVKKAEQLENAVKKVWASSYNFEAYESRRQAGIPDSLFMMSVFVQLAVDSEFSGVMITKDPYNPLRYGVTYIAAKRGIGIKVVEGKKIAEQVMYSEDARSIQLISRSEEDTELKLDEQGGVTEIPLNNSVRVMSDQVVIKLAGYGKKIKQLFKSNMDIEWAVSKDQVIILQARPYN